MGVVMLFDKPILLFQISEMWKYIKGIEPLIKKLEESYAILLPTSILLERVIEEEASEIIKNENGLITEKGNFNENHVIFHDECIIQHYVNEIKEINTKILDILPKNLTELQEFENISEGEEKHLIAMISEVKYLVSWVNNEIKQKLGL